MTNSPQVGDTWYRLTDNEFQYDCPDLSFLTGSLPARGIQPEELTVVKLTASGVWVEQWGGRHFVLLNAHKRFAYPTKALALESYVKRKEHQTAMLRAQLQKAEAYLAAARKLSYD